ncbi:MAG TPA: IS4 family transposase [Roseiflexaceae bacterium]|nr:IS4 family transposase [Roseiflexaceae bacterium]
MRDTTRRYVAILRSLTQLYQPTPQGHQRQRLLTMALLISGVIGGQHCQLPQVIRHTPGRKANDGSTEQRFRRWLQNPYVTHQCWMLPVAQALLTQLSSQPLHLVIDGSVVGRGCIALMVSVVYRKRALPLVWLVVRGNKGHLSDELHCALLAELKPLVPAGAKVVVLGDGEFDGVAFLRALEQCGWQYVCRTASTSHIYAGERVFQAQVLCGPRGSIQAMSDVALTSERYGPLSVVAVWGDAYDAPIYLVTNLSDLEAVVTTYRKRAQIETFFADQKSRGFQVHRSHLEKPERLTRLLLVLALAYLWLVYLGTLAFSHSAYVRMLGRQRCDLSLFRLGARLLDYCLRHALPIPPASFVRLPPSLANTFSVR